MGEPNLEVVIEPEAERWGVYQVGFARKVHDEHELTTQLRDWLPELRRLHRQWRSERPS